MDEMSCRAIDDLDGGIVKMAHAAGVASFGAY